MATEFCEKCKQSHPGRACDYDDKGDCAETIEISNNAGPSHRELPDKHGNRSEE